ncbi:MAG TPA: TadE family protein [Aestuariivirgaceae bacterium]|nr:TadE family protein [Aestuariivirgaceae bacterium]
MNRLRKHSARFGRDQRGSPAVEFAMIAPVLILLILGIVQFGFVFYTYNEMMNGAREGARRLAVGASDTSAIERSKATMALVRPYEFEPDSTSPDAVTMTIKLKFSDAMVITKLESLSTLYPTYLTASVTMHRE